MYIVINKLEINFNHMLKRLQLNCLRHAISLIHIIDEMMEDKLQAFNTITNERNKFMSIGL
jgi:hypothetical protein